VGIRTEVTRLMTTREQELEDRIRQLEAYKRLRAEEDLEYRTGKAQLCPHCSQPIDIELKKLT